MEAHRILRCAVAATAAVLLVAVVVRFGLGGSPLDGRAGSLSLARRRGAVSLGTAETDWMVKSVFATFKDSTKPDVQALLKAAENSTEVSPPHPGHENANRLGLNRPPPSPVPLFSSLLSLQVLGGP